MLVEPSFGRRCEANHEKMLHYGASIGMTMGELFRITDPDTILGLWTAAVVKNVED
jgi:hypothetical protein